MSLETKIKDVVEHIASEMKKLTWTDYVTRATFISQDWEVLTYTYKGTTIYRKVPSPYIMSDDRFYSDIWLVNELARRE